MISDAVKNASETEVGKAKKLVCVKDTWRKDTISDSTPPPHLLRSINHACNECVATQRKNAELSRVGNDAGSKSVVMQNMKYQQFCSKDIYI